MARPCCSNVTSACACKADGTNLTGDGTSLNPFSLSTAAQNACACVGDGVTVTGSGTADDPFVSVGAGGAIADGVTITGAGTAEDPLVAVGGTGGALTFAPVEQFNAGFPNCNRGVIYIENGIPFTRPAASCRIIDSCDAPPGPGNLPEFQGMGPAVTLDNSAATNEFNNTVQSLYTMTYTHDTCMPAQVKIESGGWYARYRLFNDTAVSAGLFTAIQGRIRLAVNTVTIDDHQAFEVRDEALNGKTGESVTQMQGGHYAKVFTIQPGDVIQYDIWSQVFTDERTQGLVTMSGKTSIFINECNDARLNP